MNRLYFSQVCSLALLLVGSLEAAQFKFPNQTLTVPDGFEVEQVGGPPLADRPISGSFDEEGRLYVTDSSGSNDKPDKQLIEKPHRVMRLDLADASGRFNKSEVFAQHMMFPEGCMWFDGSLYVSAPPSIWKLTGSEHGGDVSDQRTEWHQGKTLTGCANDLHGPYLGLDGWIYWCKGAFARQSYDRPGRKPLVTRASHIFRAPPDHSDLEPVLTAGMDNPVGVVFLLSGERFMCGTFLMHPEAGKRDGIVHAVYGGVYGKSNDVLDDHPKTGDLMPIMTHLGAAAPCSIIRYDSTVFGPEYRDSLFVCDFNLHKVSRHVLQADGATFKTQDFDFVVSDNPDFHPTDVIEDADGSLLVIDTGAWYKLCCPTSQLSKPDVLGAIYRIRRAGAPRITDPRGLQIAWHNLELPELAKLLGDERPAVRKRALQQLGKQGETAVPALSQAYKDMPSAEARANVVWALTRIAGPAARSAVRLALGDSAEVVRHAATHSAGLWRDPEAEVALIGLLEPPSAPLQRAAAEALGRIGNKAAVPALLKVCSKPQDRVLEHSLIYALIELGAAEETAVGVKSASVNGRRCALIALDQMDNGGIQPAMVVPLLNSPDPLLRQTAMWVAGHHPDWGAELAGYFSQRLKGADLSSTTADGLERQLAQFAEAKPIQEIVGEHLRNSETPQAVRQLLLEAMVLATPKEVPSLWVQGVVACLTSPDESLVREAVATARAMNQAKDKPVGLAEPLLRLARDGSRPEDLRVAAVAALPAGSLFIDPELMNLLAANLDPAKPVLQRGAAAGVLAKSKLTDDELLTLTVQLKTCSPLETTRLLDAFEQSTNEVVGTSLVESLQGSKSLTSLRPDVLQKLLAHYPPPVQERGKELLAVLQVDASKQNARLEELMSSLGKGDIRRGQTVFNSQKAACSSCHAMGYLGGHVGPDLTSIGQIRTERDLLESIVYPSASFVRSFEPYVVKTKSDDDYSGVLRKDAPDEIVLATGPSTEVRIARSEIVEMRPGSVSVMPAGLDQQLSTQELADLVTFLKATKWGAQ